MFQTTNQLRHPLLFEGITTGIQPPNLIDTGLWDCFVTNNLVNYKNRFQATTVRSKSHHNRDSTNDKEDFLTRLMTGKKPYCMIAELVDQAKNTVQSTGHLEL